MLGGIVFSTRESFLKGDFVEHGMYKNDIRYQATVAIKTSFEMRLRKNNHVGFSTSCRRCKKMS